MNKICIGCQFDFEAAHKLPNEEIYGACANIHGHRYELTIEVSGKVNENGWVANFSDVKKVIREKVIQKFDHGYLNDFIEIPTAENIVMYIHNMISDDISQMGCEIESIKIYETKNNYAILKISIDK